MKKRIFPLAIFLAAILAISTGFLIPGKFLTTDEINSFSKLMSSIFPGILIMSREPINPARALATWSTQWAFFFIYFVILFIYFPPWGKSTQIGIEKYRSRTSIGKRRFSVIFGLLILFVFIASDFGFPGLPGLGRGTFFQGNPKSLPILLRMPFISEVGMIFYAWIIPLANAFCYYGFIKFIINFSTYLREDS